MHNVYLQKLKLLHYRNFQELEINIDNNPIILIGENGSGKTNILEAISLFYPGKGLRSAKLDDICQRGVESFAVYCLLQSKLGAASILINFNSKSTKRITEFNGAKIPNNELSKFSSMIWLTPQMDGIFASGVSDRRKFLDRLVYNFLPSHAGLVARYEYYMRERSEKLSQEQVNEN